MKRFVLSLLFCFSTLLSADFNLNEYRSPIISIDEDDTATIIDSPEILIGSSGVVVHKFEYDSSIIARVSVISKNGGFAKVRFEVFDTLAQPALPLPGIAPQVGDTVVLNYLYNRSLIIVPNKEIYDEIIAAFPRTIFIHPDLIGAYLSYEYKPNPSRDDFRKMCSQSAAGLIFIAMDRRSVFADCQSFKILKEFKTGEVEYYQLPFYTRVSDIDTVFWKLDAAHINNYDEHYDNLLYQE
ncbi:plasminogen-binding N-terminal domain-containing protein [Campylobacter sp. faydin G-24]|uniref:Plasminogen-binding N-terminal domain-containing protein n=1 Tax=Campylobacter anatolicus TaxID=2829105 RepID=A0ABS5HHI4_9BACT|nr:plasminogen-binding N-terminal domain-containing protein [Campylobacter anatolicus]MBR8463736.1 plasminogen-binding N-terminal domain-containing protein [Campylobacter anatolicus]